MKSAIYIPKKINVGYQEREDTYTGKLAYVIYWDEKVYYEKRSHGMGGETKVFQMMNLKIFQRKASC